jgi:deazaflavin-dependent oxidoreductase (nitroreductase family)
LTDETLVKLSTNRAATWFIRHVASRLDPVLFRLTGGRLTVFGPPTIPMMTVHTIGRKSGRLRPVQLACVPHGGDFLVVASAMGQPKHPGWRYNLESHPEVDVQMKSERFRVRAELLSDAEKERVWDEIRAVVPQVNVYVTRTDRNIRVFRLRRIEGEAK